MIRLSKVRTAALATVLMTAIAAAACGDDDGGLTALPPGGTLRVSLATPNSGMDGAAVIILHAPAPPRAVTAGAGLTLWGGPVQAADATIAVTGVLSAGTILTIDVDDISLADQYTATLREVSSAADDVALRDDLTGYSLTIAQE